MGAFVGIGIPSGFGPFEEAEDSGFFAKQEVIVAVAAPVHDVRCAAVAHVEEIEGIGVADGLGEGAVLGPFEKLRVPWLSPSK